MADAIDAVFGPRGRRRALVVAGACGTVGFGKLGQLARLLAPQGVPVVGLDVIDAVHGVPERLRAEFAKKFPPAKVDAILASVSAVRGGPAEAGVEAGFVFEAVPERLDLKQKLFRQAREVWPDSLLFSATSGFTTRQLYAGLPGAERSGVLHPFFPHLTNKIFELPVDGTTGSAALDAARALLAELGLLIVPVRDVASFAADRIFCMLMLEAIRIHIDTGLDPAAVDAIARRAFGASPILVHNMIRGANGLTVSCIDLLAQEHPSPLYDVPQAFREKAKDPGATWPYDKSKAGFGEKEFEDARGRLLGNVFAVSSYIVENEIASARDLNFMAEEALRWRLGPPGLLREVGAAEAKRLAGACLARARVPSGTQVAGLGGLDRAAKGELYVSTADRGSVRVIELGRSSLNHIFVDELGRALEGAMKDPSVRAVVLAPDGRFNEEFGRGADVVCFLPALGDEGKARELAAGWKKRLAPIQTGGKPVVAALAKRSLGGSNELAFLCHYRVAAKGTVVGQPEPSVGVVPGLGGTHTLLRTVPPAARPEVARLLLTGNPVDAGRAFELELVQEVVEAEDLLDRAIAAARELAGGSRRPAAFESGPFAVELPDPLPAANGEGLVLDPEYVQFLAETIRGSASRPFAEAQEYETSRSGAAFTRRAAAIGVKALLSGKKPEFR
ncbi:MAG: enoyl-CoA hydratase/isomerase family protein [Planctomycetes bacterium]|nr:enoyl-CoA hydratase/isomerase family protein [Planctomycetota bacterium]